MKIGPGLLLAAALGLSASSAAAEAPVKLLYAIGQTDGPLGNVVGQVEVQNIAFAKKVTLVYAQEGGGSGEVAATYTAPTHDGLEAWGFATPSVYGPGFGQGQAVFLLKLRYEVAGQTYWDDNGGPGYRVATGFSPNPADAVTTLLLVQSRLVLASAGIVETIDEGGAVHDQFGGAVAVKNLAFEKTVTIVYSLDDWQTVQYADAAFYSGANDADGAGAFETWVFAFDVPPTVERVRYAVRYQVAGQTYWDNNFGEDYLTARTAP